MRVRVWGPERPAGADQEGAPSRPIPDQPVAAQERAAKPGAAFARPEGAGLLIPLGGPVEVVGVGRLGAPLVTGLDAGRAAVQRAAALQPGQPLRSAAPGEPRQRQAAVSGAEVAGPLQQAAPPGRLPGQLGKRQAGATRTLGAPLAEEEAAAVRVDGPARQPVAGLPVAGLAAPVEGALGPRHVGGQPLAGQQQVGQRRAGPPHAAAAGVVEQPQAGGVVGPLGLIGLALGPQLLGHTGINWALKHLTPALVAIAILAEPIGSALLAWWVFNEQFAMLQLAGFALLLTGLFLALRSPRK